MQVGRFWSSVGSVAAYLFGVGLLDYIVLRVVGLFGLLPAGLSLWVIPVVGVIMPILGTIAYLDWRWGWRLEHIGMGWSVRSLGRLVLGAVLGVIAGFGSYVLWWLTTRPGPLMPAGLSFLPPNWPEMITGLGGAFAIEMVFRGATASRYEADLHDWEIVAAAVFTPFVWTWLQRIFGLGILQAGVDTLWMGAMSVALTMLFLRTDSAWLTAGLRFGMMAAVLVLPLQIDGNGAVMLWSIVALVLLVLEWLRRQSMPKRMQPRRGPQRTTYGRTVRGPWGPH